MLKAISSLIWVVFCLTNTSAQSRNDSFFNDNINYQFYSPIGERNSHSSYTSPEGKTYKGWYIATKFCENYSLGIHPAEDWNGNGGGNTDKGQPVFSIGHGKVIDARDYSMPWGNVVTIEHKYYENGRIKLVYGIYAHLDEIAVAKGDKVIGRSKIGTIGDAHGSFPAHLHFEIRKSSMKDYPANYWPSSNNKNTTWVKEHYHHPSNFIKRKSSNLCNESDLIIAIKSEYKLYHYKKGELFKSYDMALGQNPLGHKQKQGDNRTPEGEYKIIQKSRGPFEGNMGPFFGVAWMRLNYPNSYDAKMGHKKGKISKEDKDRIVHAISSNKEPPKTTALGGGIGIHGWNGVWTANGSQNLTWGCISLNNNDLDIFYEEIPLNTKIIIHE